jgi:hypothetical protein
MATATKAYNKKRKPAARKKSSGSWLAWVPLLVGIAAIPVAFRAASILVLSGTDALTLLYPFVQIVKSPVLKVPGEIANPVAQWAMYLQFPVYGLLMTRLLRTRSFLTAIGAAVFLHGAGILVAHLLAHAQNPYLNF